MAEFLQQITVRSKWGAEALYEHRGDLCPYIPINLGWYPVGGDGAIDIHFYRRHICEYASDPTTVDGDFHTGTCTCGVTVTEKHHSWRYTKKDTYQHTKTCTECGYSTTEGHSWTQFLSNYKCEKCLFISMRVPVDLQNLNPILRTQLLKAIADGESEITIQINEDAALYYKDGQCYVLTDENLTETQVEQILDVVCVEPISRGGFEREDSDDAEDDE